MPEPPPRRSSSSSPPASGDGVRDVGERRRADLATQAGDADRAAETRRRSNGSTSPVSARRTHATSRFDAGSAARSGATASSSPARTNTPSTRAPSISTYTRSPVANPSVTMPHYPAHVPPNTRPSPGAVSSAVQGTLTDRLSAARRDGTRSAARSSGGGTRTHNLSVNSRAHSAIELPRIVLPRTTDSGGAHSEASRDETDRRRCPPRPPRGSWRTAGRTCRASARARASERATPSSLSAKRFSRRDPDDGTRAPRRMRS